MGIPPIYRVLLEKLAAPEALPVVQRKIRGRRQEVRAMPTVPAAPAPTTAPRAPRRPAYDPALLARESHTVQRMVERGLVDSPAAARTYLASLQRQLNRHTGRLPTKFRMPHPSGGHTIWERYSSGWAHKSAYSGQMAKYEALPTIRQGRLDIPKPPSVPGRQPKPFTIGGGPPRPPMPRLSLGKPPSISGKPWKGVRKQTGLEKGQIAHLMQDFQQAGKPSAWWEKSRLGEGKAEPQSWKRLSKVHGMSSNKLRKIFRTMAGRGLVKVGAALQAYMLAMEKLAMVKISRVPGAVKMYRRALVSLRGGNLFHGTNPKRVAGIARSGTLPAFPGTHGKGVYMWRDGPRSTYMRRPDQPGVIMSRSRTKLGPTPKPPEGGVRGRFPERPYMAISSTPVKLPPKSYLSTTPEQLRAARQGMTKNRLRPMDSAIFHRAEADMAMGRIDPDMVKRPTKRDLVRLLRRKTQPKTVGMIRSKRTNQELNLLHGQYDRAVGREPLVDPKTGLFDYV